MKQASVFRVKGAPKVIVNGWFIVTRVVEC